MAKQLICKVELDGDMRRIQLSEPISFATLLEQIKFKFALDNEARYRLVFEDSDGDLITVSSTESLLDASTCSSITGVLRLQLIASPTFLFTSSKPSSSSSSSSTSSSSQQEFLLAQRQYRMLQARRQMLNRRAECMKSRTEAHLKRIEEQRAALEQQEQTLLRQFPELASSTALPTEEEQEETPCFRGRRAFPHPFFNGATRCPAMMGERRGCPAMSHVVCDDCGQTIEKTDIRFKCADCPNFDLCAACESKSAHDPAHALLKLRPEAQANHSFLPIHRPILGGGRGGFFRGGRCPRFSAAAAAAPVDPMSHVRKLFEEVILPQIAGDIPSCIDVKAIFSQVMDTVQKVQPELLEGLPELAREICSQKDSLDLEKIVLRLAQFAEPKIELIKSELLPSLIQTLLPTIQSLLPTLLSIASPQQQQFGAAINLQDLFGLFGSPAQQPQHESPDFFEQFQNLQAIFEAFQN